MNQREVWLHWQDKLSHQRLGPKPKAARALSATSQAPGMSSEDTASILLDKLANLFLVLIWLAWSGRLCNSKLSEPSKE